MLRSNVLQTLLWQVGWWSHVSLLTAFLEMHIAQLQLKTYLQLHSAPRDRPPVKSFAITSIPAQSRRTISWSGDELTTRQRPFTNSVRPLTPYPHELSPMDSELSYQTNSTLSSCGSPANPFSDSFEIDEATVSAEPEFVLNDFYNQVSPKRGFPYSRSRRLTSMLLTIVPPIDCEDTSINDRYYDSATPLSSRMDAFNKPAQRALGMEWTDEYVDSPSIDTALVRSRDEMSAATENTDRRPSTASLYSHWNDLPSPISPLVIPR